MSVYLKCIIPTRLKKIDVFDTRENTRTYTGKDADTTTLDGSTYDEWDKDKIDYKRLDRVKIANLKKEYECGVDDTTVYPPTATAEWFEVGSTNDFRYRDETPLELSLKEYTGEDDEGFNVELNLGRQETSLFIQNMRNIKTLIIEAWIDGAWIEIETREMYYIYRFSPCSCCLLEWRYRTNYTLELEACQTYSKIRVTFLPTGEDWYGVGTVAVGEFLKVGNFCTYPNIKLNSDFKFDIKNVGLAFPQNLNKWINFSEKVHFDTVDQDVKVEKLLDNVGAWVYFSIEGLKSNLLSKFIGTYADFETPITNKKETTVNFQVYGIPSENTGGI